MKLKNLERILNINEVVCIENSNSDGIEYHGILGNWLLKNYRKFENMQVIKFEMKLDYTLIIIK